MSIIKIKFIFITSFFIFFFNIYSQDSENNVSIKPNINAGFDLDTLLYFNSNLNGKMNIGANSCGKLDLESDISINFNGDASLKFSVFANVFSSLQTELGALNLQAAASAGGQVGYGTSFKLKLDKEKSLNLDYISNFIAARYQVGVGVGNSLSAPEDIANLKPMKHKITIQYIDESGSLIKAVSFSRLLSYNLFIPNESILKFTFKNNASCFISVLDAKSKPEFSDLANSQSVQVNTDPINNIKEIKIGATFPISKNRKKSKKQNIIIQ